MGVTYSLVNHTKREYINFTNLGTWKMSEIASIPASSVLTTWYMLNNLGDEISFVTDCQGEWPFSSGTRADLSSYPDVTDPILDELLEQGILRDNGLLCEDYDLPDSSRIRDIRSTYDPDGLS